MNRLYIFCGCAQTRGLLQINGKNVGLFFSPPIYDPVEKGVLPIGSVLVGRILKNAPGFHGAFIDIGLAADAFLPGKKSTKIPNEGSIRPFKIRRLATGRKGSVVELINDTAQSNVQGKVGDILSRPTPIESILSDIHRVDEIVVDSTEAVGHLPPEHRLKTTIGIPAETFEFCQDQLSQSLSREVYLAGGGRIIIDETEGPTIIDIDAGDRDRSKAQASTSVNQSAAKVLMREISLRSIGGRVVVDFLPPANAKEKEELLSILKRDSKHLLGARLGRLQTDGLFDFTLPKRGPSLLEQATKRVSVGLVRGGLRLTDEWIACEIIFEVERRLKFGHSSTKLEVLTSKKLVEGVFASNVHWTKSLSERYGPRLKFTAVNTSEEWDYDIHEGQ